MNFPYQVIDLTHPISEHTPSWNGGCGFQHTIELDYEDCYTAVRFRVQHFQMPAGLGTHMDAPAHCIKGAATVEDIPLHDLIASARCIDVSNKISPTYKLSSQDIIHFEKQYGLIPPACFVIIYTGWSQHWSQPDLYHNQHRFPSISLEAAELLLERKVVGIGIDTLSPDIAASEFPVHQLMLGSGKYIVENVAHANQMPASGAYVMTLPIKAVGLTEAPVRMLGLLPRSAAISIGSIQPH